MLFEQEGRKRSGRTIFPSSPIFLFKISRLPLLRLEVARVGRAGGEVGGVIVRIRGSATGAQGGGRVAQGGRGPRAFERIRAAVADEVDEVGVANRVVDGEQRGGLRERD